MSRGTGPPRKREASGRGGGGKATHLHVPRLLQRVARVRNELTNKHVRVSVQRVCHDLQQLLRLRLERVLLDCVTRAWRDSPPPLLLLQPPRTPAARAPSTAGGTGGADVSSAFLSAAAAAAGSVAPVAAPRRANHGAPPLVPPRTGSATTSRRAIARAECTPRAAGATAEAATRIEERRAPRISMTEITCANDPVRLGWSCPRCVWSR